MQLTAFIMIKQNSRFSLPVLHRQARIVGQLQLPRLRHPHPQNHPHLQPEVRPRAAVGHIQGDSRVARRRGEKGERVS